MLGTQPECEVNYTALIANGTEDDQVESMKSAGVDMVQTLDMFGMWQLLMFLYC